jgi:flagellar biosynthesis protein FlhA
MPGKQMAVDAELNAGLIDEGTAKARRAEIAREADFHGAMDGASKFVRGDAIAGIVITFVNAIGGVFVGTLQHDMAFGDAVQTFLILTIGDGLAGQVPALIVSTAAGLLVTRVSDTESNGLADQIESQFLQGPVVLTLGAGVLGMLALVPGLTVPFALMAGATGYGAWRISQRPPPAPPPPPDARPAADARPEDLLGLEALAVEFAGDLLYLVDEKAGGEFLQRIGKVRQQFAQDLGLVLPPVHVRDDLAQPQGTYRILLRGEPIATGKLYPRQHLALDPGTVKGPVGGIAVTDPVFGLPASWIPAGLTLKAQQLGYTVVDVPTVVTTHLVELMHIHGHELFDPGQLDRALDRVLKAQPRLVEDLTPDPLPRITLLRVFRNLLREDLSVRDATTVLEALAEHAPKAKDADLLTELVRQRMARQISRKWAPEGTLPCVALGPVLEDAVLRGLTAREGMAPVLQIDPPLARTLIVRAKELTEAHAGATPAVLLCPPLARGAVRRLLERALPRVPVLSTAELLPHVRLLTVGVIEPDKALKAS